MTANLIPSRDREPQKLIDFALYFGDTLASKFPKILVTISRHVRHQSYKVSRLILIKNCRRMRGFDNFALAKRFAIVQIQDNIDLATQHQIT